VSEGRGHETEYIRLVSNQEVDGSFALFLPAVYRLVYRRTFYLGPAIRARARMDPSRIPSWGPSSIPQSCVSASRKQRNLAD
jgi:hypothetical protein